MKGNYCQGLTEDGGQIGKREKIGEGVPFSVRCDG